MCGCVTIELRLDRILMQCFLHSFSVESFISNFCLFEIQLVFVYAGHYLSIHVTLKLRIILERYSIRPLRKTLFASSIVLRSRDVNTFVKVFPFLSIPRHYDVSTLFFQLLRRHLIHLLFNLRLLLLTFESSDSLYYSLLT